MRRESGTGLDRPWKRPGAWRYGWSRLHGMLYPPVTVSDRPDDLVMDLDVPVPVRDGTVLEVNVHRPPGPGPFPGLLSAHRYGKDKLPYRKRGYGYSVAFQYRMLRQPAPVRFSRLTSWEAPDPAWWVAQGYAVVNADLRGAGASAGAGSPLSDQEGEDVFDLVEWAGAQSWSSGSVALVGVSYLAIAQWKAAALRPPSLKAIVPWEGFPDAYRGLFRPGGVEEVGFSKLWARGLRGNRQTYSLPEESSRRPLRDDWWRSLAADLPAIEVPALICGSFSDNNLHSRGSVEAFEQISSTDKHLWTHRGGTWSTFYSDDALAAQVQFLNRHLRGRPEPELPRVRLEVRESRDEVVEVRAESAWPLPDTTWTPLYLTADGLATEPAADAGSISFTAKGEGVRFDWTVSRDVELTGPMALKVFLELDGATDACLVAGIEKWRGAQYVPFEGSYGFGRDRVCTGWQRASLRALDPQRSRPFAPVPACTSPQPITTGEVVAVDVALGNSATLFRAGETLRVVLATRWLWPRNPFTGQFPAAYDTRPKGTCTLHWGAGRDAALLVPVIG